MKFQHIIFDWDGTLADTYPVISAAYDYTFDMLCLPRIPYNEVKRITGTLQNKDILSHIFGEREQEASDVFYNYMDEFHTDKLVAMPHAKELMTYCKEKELNVYLITNKRTHFVMKEIEKLGFDGYFKKIVAAGEFEQDKPHPIAAHAVFDNEIPDADTILMIGDGEADIQTVRAYGHDGKRAECVIYDPNDKFRGSMPDYRVRDLADIIVLLGKE